MGKLQSWGAAYVQGTRQGCMEEGASLGGGEESGGKRGGVVLKDFPLSRGGGEGE